MITVTIRHENGNGIEFGYGVYVNAYVTWDDIPGDLPTLYASECVPFGQNTPQNIRAAERKAKRNAKRNARREYVGH